MDEMVISRLILKNQSHEKWEFLVTLVTRNNHFLDFTEDMRKIKLGVPTRSSENLTLKLNVSASTTKKTKHTNSH